LGSSGSLGPNSVVGRSLGLTGRRQRGNLRRPGRGLRGASGGSDLKEEPLRTFLAVVFMVISTAQANAKFLDGKALHDWCFSEDIGDQEACLGYVIAIADVLSSDDTSELTKYRACIPEVDATQVVNTAKKYLEFHPQAGDTTAANLVAIALSEAFPCP
jgi:hypothetical protein